MVPSANSSWRSNAHGEANTVTVDGESLSDAIQYIKRAARDDAAGQRGRDDISDQPEIADGDLI